ncbi:MAG: serine/threonine-protein kinase [Kofleriaceae bacterium]
MAKFADVASDADTLPAGDPRAITNATHHGRYQIRGLLGTGGMGIVLDAFDPVLDRPVALKLLHPEVSLGDAGKDAADRLTREARAMAKISHPNVVTVYEVGWSGAQIFLAMERVDGTTLRTWLGLGTASGARGPHRSWRSVTRMFVAAGRGLAAAHRVGLVHRDFKPDNVLIGKDGRPRVTDFGLVTTSALAPKEHGDITGTPAYMAPEQWLNAAEVGAAADQFAFCVAVWEGLCGERPIRGTTPLELRTAATLGSRPPRHHRIPKWIDRVLRRGLAVDPADRWPSLDVLLDRLERGLRRRGRLIAVAALAGVSASVATAVLLPTEREACPLPDAQIVAVWGSARRAALVAHSAPRRAGALVVRVSEHVDREVAAWATAHQAACHATRVAGTQSDTMLDERMFCLNTWVAELDETLALALRVTAPDELEHALSALFDLPPLEQCSDTATLNRRLAAPAPSGKRAEIRSMETSLRAVQIDLRAERYAGLLERVRAIAVAAQAIGYPPLEVEALEAKSRIELHLNLYAESVETLRTLIQRAALARDDRAETTAWTRLISIQGYHRGESDAALALEPAAAAALARAGSPIDLKIEHELRIAQVLDQGPRAAEAIARLTSARALLETVQGAQWSPRLAELGVDLLAELANAYSVAGDDRAAVAVLREARDGYRELLGPGTLDESMVLNNLGDNLRRQGDYAEALDVLREAARIVEAKTGQSARLAVTVMQLSYVLGELDRWPEALEHAVRGVAIGRATLDEGDLMLPISISGQASALSSLGRRDEALARFAEAIALFERIAPDIHFPIALYNRGELAFDLRRFDEAERDYRRAIELFETTRPGTPMRLYPLVGLGRIHVQQRRFADARTELERALAIEPDGADRGMAAAARVWLARATANGRVDHGSAAMKELAALAATDPAARREHAALLATR